MIEHTNCCAALALAFFAEMNNDETTLAWAREAARLCEEGRNAEDETVDNRP
jgi:hypothetical protein